MYRLIEADAYTDKYFLVVGGGDSAISTGYWPVPAACWLLAAAVNRSMNPSRLPLAVPGVAS